jgi:hypothetical protein
MAQSAIQAKYTYTVLTGTTGDNFLPVGRDNNNVLSWRADVSGGLTPASDIVLANSGVYRAKSGQANGWTSKTTFVAPVMETLSSGTSAGYVATPKVADRTNFTLLGNRTSLMSQAVALKMLDEFLGMCLSDSKLRAAIVGYAPADS